MMRSLYSGVSGLKTHQTKMDVIGNNIANVNTVAFKSSSVTFGELMYQTTSNASSPNADTGRGGVNAKQIGLGVQMGATNVSITTTGATQTTGNPFDLKITGDSFFIVNDGQSNYFTRAGAFYVDAVGNLAMTSTGYNVMGWQVGNDGEIIQNTVSPIKILSAEHMFSQPEATELGTCSGVLDKSDPNLTSDAGKVLSLSIFDDLGYEYTAKFSIKPFKTALNTTKQVTNTTTTYNTIPTIRETTDDSFKFSFTSDVIADSAGSEITKYTAPVGPTGITLYDALRLYSMAPDTETAAYGSNAGNNLADGAIINMDTTTAAGKDTVTKLANIMGLKTSGTSPTLDEFLTDPSIVGQGRAIKVGRTPVTSYAIVKGGNTTPLDGITAKTMNALETAGVLEKSVNYAPKPITMEDLTKANNIYKTDPILEDNGSGGYKPTTASGYADMDAVAAAGIVIKNADGTYSPKQNTMADLITKGIIVENADGTYSPNPTSGYADMDAVVSAGYVVQKGNTYKALNPDKQDLVRYESRYYDGQAPAVSYYLINTDSTSTDFGKKTELAEALKNVPADELGIFLGSCEYKDITILDTNEPVNKISYIEGQYTVELSELIDISNGKTSINFDILGDTSRTLMFDTNDGKFRYIGAEGTSDYDLHLSALGGKFHDVAIDFSSTKNVSNEGTSTIGMKAGDEDGNGSGKLLGALKGVSVDSNGKIYGSYDNGNTELLGQIAVTEFANASGLEKVGDNLYQTTLNSGEFDGIGRDISSLSGSMTTGVLEMSNVDLSAEFTDMITTQRGFQANSRIITTSDTLLEELINLKR